MVGVAKGNKKLLRFQSTRKPVAIKKGQSCLNMVVLLIFYRHHFQHARDQMKLLAMGDSMVAEFLLIFWGLIANPKL